MNKKITTPKWGKTEYQKIKDVKIADNILFVAFENGDSVEIQKANIVPFGTENVEWDHISFNPFEIQIPAKPDIIEIPWDKIRVLTDSDFGKYLAGLAEERAKSVGTKIKILREKTGMRSNELANRAGISPQTISRIEQGHTDVTFGTLKKILAAMGHTLKDLANQEIEFEKKPKSFAALIKRLSNLGIDNNLLNKKIIPKHIHSALGNYQNNQPEMLLDEAASYVGNIYGWTLDEIWNSNALNFKNDPASAAYFKKPSNSNINQVKAYSHYAFYLSKIVTQAYYKDNSLKYPGDIDEFKITYQKRYQKFDLESLLNFTWDMGICVLPLNDSGVFHGASWNIEGSHVIVLKQNTKAHARWIFDLLHELYHVFAHLDQINTSVIESEELNPFSNNESIEELEANSFANKVVFEDRAEELAAKCVEEAGWQLEKLKIAVAKISKTEKIREDFISNYLAFRLNHQGNNWWATANKMQITDPDPFQIAANLLKERVSIEKLNPIDSNLLNMAISN